MASGSWRAVRQLIATISDVEQRSPCYPQYHSAATGIVMKTSTGGENDARLPSWLDCPWHAPGNSVPKFAGDIALVSRLSVACARQFGSEVRGRHRVGIFFA